MLRSGPIALTLGDPAGVGPEVAAKWLATQTPEFFEAQSLLLVGSRAALDQGARCAGVELPQVPQVVEPSQFNDGLGILDLGPLPPEFCFGEVQAGCGSLAVAAVTAAAQLCLSGKASAMVTCPLNKEAIHAAGFVDDIGHQEILARLASSDDTATMLMTPGLKVVHLSTHKSLGEAVGFVTEANVLARLRLCQRALQQWGLTAPRIAVAGLNPHNGEGGLLGTEEQLAIAPAVAKAAAEGIDANGPIPADSVFNRAIAGEFDVVLAMYHDQGHIAIKVHDFHRSTTATLGLPFIRTSVDHGTAFDIAGRGVADATGLGAAITMAAALVNGELGQVR
ncbi:MAG: 4-hydroxythreonine-4-phosphate dehydrogenase PdxA [Pseudomonadales bacterium]